MRKPEVGFAPWTLVHRADRRIVGWGGLNIDPNAREWGPEVSYFIHSGYQGKGLATELVRASLEFGFARLNLPAIGAFARPENVGSARVLVKCGFTFVGYEPNAASAITTSCSAATGAVCAEGSVRFVAGHDVATTDVSP